MDREKDGLKQEVKMSDYPYNLTAIATHLRELAKSIAKKLDISEQDAWDLCIEKLESKYLQMDSQYRIKKTLFNDDCLTKEDNNDSMS